MTTIPQILITPPWKEKGSRKRKPKLPENLVIEELPPLIIKESGEHLPLEYVENLLCILTKSEMKQDAISWLEPLTDETFLEVKNVFTNKSMLAFGQALQQQLGVVWMRHLWLYPIGQVEIDDIKNSINIYHHEVGNARKLTRILALNYQWYSNPLALETLFFQHQKGKNRHRGIANRMIEYINDNNIFTDYKLSYDERYDLTLTDHLGFDAQGKKPFLFNGHTLEIRLDSHLQPMLFDVNGKFLKSLPRAKKDDDKELIEQQKEEYKALKKQLKDFLKHHEKRFKTDFAKHKMRHYQHVQKVYLKNPLIKKMAQGLVWGLYEQVDDIKQFRNAFIMQDDEWLNSDYDDVIEVYNLDNAPYEQYHIAILHPAQLNQKQRHIFQQMLADFEKVALFEQMDMPVCPLLSDGKPKHINHLNGYSFSESCADSAFKEIIGHSDYSYKDLTSKHLLDRQPVADEDDCVICQGISYTFDSNDHLDIYFKEAVKASSYLYTKIDSDENAVIDYIDVSNCYNLPKLDFGLNYLLETLQKPL